MLKAIQQLARHALTRLPYPLALQCLVTLALLALPASALGRAGGVLSLRFTLATALVGLHLALCWLVPVRRLRFWLQLIYLSLQIGAVSLAHVLAPSGLLGYVYLVIVLQAVYLFRPLLWAPFAGAVYVIWSGSLLLVSASLIDWMRQNLALAFPVLCILIAAAVYARQHQRYEQVQQVLQHMQRRYDTLLEHLRDAQQRATLEERHRLAQTIASDITQALVQIEQSIASAIGQAQTNFARLDTTVAQTRVAATAAIDRMRAAVVTLRLSVREDLAPAIQQVALTLPPDEIMTSRSLRTLTWGLPLAFVVVALPLALLQSPVTPALAGLFGLCCVGLVGGYVFTQRIRNPLLMQLGLAGQVLAVLGMVFITQALPLMLGLLLVIWQISMRFSTGPIVAFLIAIQTMVGLALTRVLPVSIVDGTQLLILGVACAAVMGLVGPARRQLARRRQDEARLLQLAHLTGELDQQLAQAHALAVTFERTRLAREIHDDLGHRLMLLNVQLQLVEELSEEDPGQALAQLCSTREQLRAAWSSVLSTDGAVLDLDGATLAYALDCLVAHCRSSTPMQITLKVIGDLADIGQPTARTIYRAVQEGLTNACKHAQARQLNVLVYRDDAEARVHVSNDAGGDLVGHAAQLSAQPAGHFGLLGLRERAELLGGSLEARLLPEGGFLLAMTIPLL